MYGEMLWYAVMSAVAKEAVEEQIFLFVLRRLGFLALGNVAQYALRSRFFFRFSL